jgi:hypothetical protein
VARQGQPLRREQANGIIEGMSGLGEGRASLARCRELERFVREELPEQFAVIDRNYPKGYERLVHFDRAGDPLTLGQWAYLFECYQDYRRVAVTEDVNGFWVSTVWMGIDHSFGAGPPLIFETMRQLGRGSLRNEYRWPTEEAALAGHDQLVEALRRFEDPDASYRDAYKALDELRNRDDL